MDSDTFAQKKKQLLLQRLKAKKRAQLAEENHGNLKRKLSTDSKASQDRKLSMNSKASQDRKLSRDSKASQDGDDSKDSSVSGETPKNPFDKPAGLKITRSISKPTHGGKIAVTTLPKVDTTKFSKLLFTEPVLKSQDMSQN